MTKQELVIVRSFEAPRDLVWKAWTEPERLRQWWGPKGFTTPFAKADLRVGGAYHNCMRSPEGTDYWSTGIYREIVPPERIVCTDSFADAEGQVVPATHYGMSADFPLEMLVTATFEEVADQTRLTLQHAGLPAGEDLDNCRTGWNESLDKLADVLAEFREGDKIMKKETTEYAGSAQGANMTAEPQKEHLWLQKFLGQWTFEGLATMEPGKPPEKFAGTESVRSLGGLWIVAEGQGESPCAETGTVATLLTLGYDPQKKRYVGTFIASMMTHLWLYDGTLDAAGKVLTLDTEGPDMEGKMAKFKDVTEFKSDDHRVLTSHMLGTDGQWHEFMTAHYRRSK